jgi:hypothetical protein
LSRSTFIGPWRWPTSPSSGTLPNARALQARHPVSCRRGSTCIRGARRCTSSPSVSTHLSRKSARQARRPCTPRCLTWRPPDCGLRLLRVRSSRCAVAGRSVINAWRQDILNVLSCYDEIAPLSYLKNWLCAHHRKRLGAMGEMRAAAHKGNDKYHLAAWSGVHYLGALGK